MALTVERQLPVYSSHPGLYMSPSIDPSQNQDTFERLLEGRPENKVMYRQIPSCFLEPHNTRSYTQEPIPS